MITQLLLVFILLYPLLLGLSFRVATGHIFFALMAGELLGRYFGHDVDEVVVRYISAWQDGYGEITLIALPMLLTSFFLRKSTSKGKILLHAVPLAITGVILAAFVLPLLPQSTQEQIATIWFGAKLLEFDKIIIGVLLVVQLLWLWGVAGREKAEHSKKKHD